jgi:hypothetical protein
MKNTSFLDYYKIVLQKVSFDSYLLAREYKKAKKAVGPVEQELLVDWMMKNGYMEKVLNYELGLEQLRSA